MGERKCTGKGKQCKRCECPVHPIKIPDDREIVDCDDREHEWKPDPKGYFLVKLERGKAEKGKGKICCGFVDAKTHRMLVEFRGSDPDRIIKEIAERGLCSLAGMGFIASELMIAKHALDSGEEYVQR